MDMRKRLAALSFALLAMLGGLGILQASPAGADTQIGWVLDADGSVQCVVLSGTTNHVVCVAYPNGGGAGTTVLDSWVPNECLGGAYMVAGLNDNIVGARLYFQNVTGYYCGHAGGSSAQYRVGACHNGVNWLSSSAWIKGAPYITRNGVYYPSSASPQPNFPAGGCSFVGASNAQFYINGV